MFVLITAAGHGSRFLNSGISTPKPLISVDDYTLLERVVDCFQTNKDTKIVIVVQRSHCVPERIDKKLRNKVIWIELDQVLSGQLVTALYALNELRKNISLKDRPLLIHNCDTGFSWSNELIPSQGSYATMAVFKAKGDHWSFARVDPENPHQAIEIVEKRRISDLCSIGLYGFSCAEAFMIETESYMSSAKPLNGEYYIAPFLNHCLLKGLTVDVPYVENISEYGTPIDVCKTCNISLELLKQQNP